MGKLLYPPLHNTLTHTHSRSLSQMRNSRLIHHASAPCLNLLLARLHDKQGRISEVAAECQQFKKEAAQNKWIYNGGPFDGIYRELDQAYGKLV